MKYKRKVSHRSGFSLVEVVIAIGLVAILLTSFFAIFAPAQRNIARALSVKDAHRLASSLEQEMAMLRQGENYTTPFDKAFQWVQQSGDRNQAIIVYSYKAHPTKQNPDETSEAYPLSADGISGRDFTLQTVARHVGSSYLSAELAPGVVEGEVFAVRMTQLVEQDSGALQLGQVGEIMSVDRDESGAVTQTKASTSDAYLGAVLTLKLEFFRLPSNQASVVTNGGWNFDNLGKPVAERNIAVRR